MWGEGLENLLHIQVKIAFYLTSSSRNTTLLQHPTKTNTMANVAFRFISLQLIQSPVAVKPNLAVPILIWRRLGELIRFLFFQRFYMAWLFPIEPFESTNLCDTTAIDRHSKNSRARQNIREIKQDAAALCTKRWRSTTILWMISRFSVLRTCKRQTRASQRLISPPKLRNTSVKKYRIITLATLN